MPDVADSDAHEVKGRFMKKTKSGRFVHYHALDGPWKYLADNEFIHRGYRVGHTVFDCFMSLFRMHNETVNVWSHAVGSLLFIGFILHLLLHFGVSGPVPPFTPSPTASPGLPPKLVSVVSSPYITSGGHTKVMMLHCVFHEEDTPAKASFMARFPSTYTLESRLNDVRSFLHHGSQSVKAELAEVEATILKLGDGLLDLQRNVTADTVARIRVLSKSLRSNLEQGLHQADSAAGRVVNAGRSALHQLSETGRRLSDRIDAFLSSTSLPLDDSSPRLPNESSVTRAPIFVFLLSAMLCLAFSATFHLFSCLGEDWWAVLAPLDYTGISLLIAGSTVPLVVYGMQCHPMWMTFHLVAIFTVNFACVLLNMLPRFRTSKFRTVRVACFIFSGVFGAVPLTHMMALNNDEFHQWLMQQLIIMGALYISGACLYALRVPERFFPGYFDRWFSSHQVFHMLVVSAAVQHYYSVISHYHYRLHTPCSS